MYRNPWDEVLFTVKHDGNKLSYFYAKGRVRWALESLIRAGERGCTPISHPAPHWSSYIYSLRIHDLDIETRKERRFGAFPGSYVRYVLRDQVERFSS